MHEFMDLSECRIAELNPIKAAAKVLAVNSPILAIQESLGEASGDYTPFYVTAAVACIFALDLFIAEYRARYRYQEMLNHLQELQNT